MKVKIKYEKKITRRELEVLRLIAEGYSVKEVALKLGLAETTIIFHKNNLRLKFDAKNASHLVSEAYRQKIL